MPTYQMFYPGGQRVNAAKWGKVVSALPRHAATVTQLEGCFAHDYLSRPKYFRNPTISITHFSLFFPEQVSGGEPEPFEVELLSDVEGVDATGHVDMRGRDCSDGDDECGFHEEDRWMGNIWSQPNRAVVMSYFCVGFAMRFLGTPLSYYLVQIGEMEGG